MATQQQLLDTVYQDFCNEVENLKIKADMPAVQVVGELTRALKRVVNNHGATAMTIDGVGYTKNQLDQEASPEVSR